MGDARLVLSQVLKADKVILVVASFLPSILCKLRHVGRIFNWRLDDKKVLNMVPSLHAALGGPHPVALHELCAVGEVDTVWLLLHLGAQVKARDAEGATVLQRAVHSGCVPLVSLLIEKTASVNARGAYGYTPLHECSYLGHEPVLRFLLQNRANVDALSKNGSTPLLVASREGSVNVVKALLEFQAHPDDGGDKGWPPLFLAAAEGHAGVVELLLVANASIQGPEGGTMELGMRTALHEAAEAGSLPVVQLLLKASADPAGRDKDGQRPLDLALAGNHEMVVKAMAEHTGAEGEPEDQ